jgi:hypothetical protein
MRVWMEGGTCKVGSVMGWAGGLWSVMECNRVG